MKSVGIRELKSNLSQYISMVKDGETLLITEHNRVVAEIRKAKTQDSKLSIEKVMRTLEKKGKLVRAKDTKYIPKKRGKSKQIDWWEIYQESKEDGI
ncbi:MAG: type II toxin-antitoxin system prevent-host-death family antitoxin [Leptospiraceae bacterium]|nr:type II toxin-antitoxin system prevent-host-death family antitoxin [Leptospiraceae bacterium]MCP5494583.1 type II toxin-antitoxin system prevent-host-death family antitoxin [Leptospiraceae bacterium]